MYGAIRAGSYSFPYVARWAEDKAVLRRNLSEVQGVAARLIAGIEAATLGAALPLWAVIGS